ncbi:MAG: hypothetical protein ABIR33_09520 [Pyrinomonadaceae bacterium]
MNKEKETADAAPVESVPVRPEEPNGARFVRGEEVVDANGVVVEGLSVKDGEIVGKEKN